MFHDVVQRDRLGIIRLDKVYDVLQLLLSSVRVRLLDMVLNIEQNPVNILRQFVFQVRGGGCFLCRSACVLRMVLSVRGGSRAR